MQSRLWSQGTLEFETFVPPDFVLPVFMIFTLYILKLTHAFYFDFFDYHFHLLFCVLGDLMEEEDVLEWLTSPDNMESSDAIEKVNRRMLERVLQRCDYLAVFFCKCSNSFLM